MNNNSDASTTFDPGALRAVDYLYSLEGFASGNELRLLVDGPDSFRAVFELIASAKHEIALDIYMFRRDEIGVRVLDALKIAANRGVRVRVIFDSIGSLFTDLEFFEPLVQSGGEVHEYHSIVPFRPLWAWTRRNHRKLLTVDGERVIIFGLNFGNEYYRSPKEGGYHDLSVLVRGFAARQAMELFDRTWHRMSRLLSLRKFYEELPPRPSDDSLGRVLGNDAFMGRWSIRKHLIHAFRTAKNSIDIANPYFLPDPAIRSELRRAAERGVHVRVLLPDRSDVLAVDLATQVIQKKLLAHGVEFYLWPGLVHMKVVTVDGIWTSIGSYNFDYQSLFRNLEVVLQTTDRKLAGAVREVFEKDVRISRRVSENDWKELSWIEKLLARVFYRFRRIL